MKYLTEWFKKNPRAVLQLDFSDEFRADLIIVDDIPRTFLSCAGITAEVALNSIETHLRSRAPKRKLDL